MTYNIGRDIQEMKEAIATAKVVCTGRWARGRGLITHRIACPKAFVCSRFKLIPDRDDIVIEAPYDPTTKRCEHFVNRIPDRANRL